MNLQDPLIPAATPEPAGRTRTPADPTSLITQLRAAHVTLSGRGAAPLRCRTCRQWTLIGHTVDGIPAHLDPYPLTPLGEALALVAGARTHELTLRHLPAGGWALQISDRRRHHRITSHPAGRQLITGRYDVVTEHRCSTSPPAGPLLATSQLPPPPAPTINDQPPF